MTNTEKLRVLCDVSGYKLKYIAEQIGLTYQGFVKKLDNKSEFKASEIQMLCRLLQIRADERESIFFADDVDEKSTRK